MGRSARGLTALPNRVRHAITHWPGTGPFLRKVGRRLRDRLKTVPRDIHAAVRQHENDIRIPLWDIRERCRSYPLAARMFRENPRTEAIDLTAIPFRIMSSLEAHRDRRDPAMRALASLGLTVRWKIPV